MSDINTQSPSNFTVQVETQNATAGQGTLGTYFQQEAAQNAQFQQQMQAERNSQIANAANQQMLWTQQGQAQDNLLNSWSGFTTQPSSSTSRSSLWTHNTTNGPVNQAGSFDFGYQSGTVDSLTEQGHYICASQSGTNDTAYVTNPEQVMPNMPFDPAPGETAPPRPQYDIVSQQGSQDFANVNGYGDNVTQNGASGMATVQGNHDNVSQQGTHDQASVSDAPGSLQGGHNSVAQGGGADNVYLMSTSSCDVTQSGDQDMAQVSGQASKPDANGSVTIGSATDDHIQQKATDGAVIAGSHDTISQTGTIDQAAIGGNNGKVQQSGTQDHATLKGDNDRVGEQGDKDTAEVDGSNDQIRINGSNNNIKVTGDGMKVSVQGSGLTASYADGKWTLGSGETATQSADGSWVISKQPAQSPCQPQLPQLYSQLESLVQQIASDFNSGHGTFGQMELMLLQGLVKLIGSLQCDRPPAATSNPPVAVDPNPVICSDPVVPGPVDGPNQPVAIAICNDPVGP